MNNYIRMYNKETEEYKRLQRAATMLTKASPTHRMYYVGNTYFDLRQSWSWTTILAENGWGGYQALSPANQEEILTAKNDLELERAVEAVLKDPYCPDKKI